MSILETQGLKLNSENFKNSIWIEIFKTGVLDLENEMKCDEML